METRVIKLFEDQSILKRPLRKKTDEIEAKKLFVKYANRQKKYQLILGDMLQFLLVDSINNIKYLSLNWDIIDGYKIYEQMMTPDEIEQVKISIYPPVFGKALGDFTIGGLLMGGIGGAIIGGFIDSIKGPKTTDVRIDFEFGKGLQQSMEP